MRKNLPIVDSENDYPSSKRIVSTTDSKGVIQHVNNDFIDISGFSKSELLGQAHNLVRHPDMPQEAFEDMWKTLKSGSPWMGIVKNRCKDGSFYWVDAFASPILEDGRITGYQSVRVKPNKESVTRASSLYSSLNKKSDGSIKKILEWRPNILSALFLVGFFSVLVSVLFGSFMKESQFNVAIQMMVGGLVSFVAAYLFATPWKKAAEEAKAVFDNSLAQKVYTGRSDELGQLKLAIKFLQSQQNTIIWRAADASQNLQTVANGASSIANSTEAFMNKMNKEVEMVSSAMTEMSATVNEVAKNASDTADATEIACEEVGHGQKILSVNTDVINELSVKIDESENIVQNLYRNSEEIGSVVDVISNIAEQTNLLALNAAIEAARAGEQGRGFAVVADEVRTLASRTQNSTGEITKIVQSLQALAQQASESMHISKTYTDRSVEQVRLSNQALGSIDMNVNRIIDMSTQIATAAEEQSQVCDEISRNVVNISASGSQTLEGCSRSQVANTDLAHEVSKLNNMITQFG